MPKKKLLPEAASAPIRRRPAIASRYRLRLVREAVLPYGDNVCLHDSAETVRFLWTYLFRDEPREVLAAIFVGSKNHATGHMIAFTGTLDRTAAEPRHILSAALVHNAAGVLVAHNHPSGVMPTSGLCAAGVAALYSPGSQ